MWSAVASRSVRERPTVDEPDRWHGLRDERLSFRHEAPMSRRQASERILRSPDPTSYRGVPLPEPTGRDTALDHARQVIALVFGPVARRHFDVRYWDGSVEHGSTTTTRFRLGVNRPGALRRILLPPNELSIVESYLSGDIDIDGELEAAMGLADEIGARVRSPRVLARLTRHLLALPRRDVADDVRIARSDTVVEPVGRPHDPSRDRAAIRFHYDVGNDFYALWLDQRMVYSCAYYRRPTDSLDEAQRAKLDLICRKLRLRPGQRFLDVGCGWGALIMHAVQHYGVSALGITLGDARARTHCGGRARGALSRGDPRLSRPARRHAVRPHRERGDDRTRGKGPSRRVFLGAVSRPRAWRDAAESRHRQSRGGAHAGPVGVAGASHLAPGCVHSPVRLPRRQAHRIPGGHRVCRAVGVRDA